MADGSESNISCTWPPIRSVSAGALPLYGTCSMSMPAAILNASPERCCDVALPADANASDGFDDFASATSSFTERAASFGLHGEDQRHVGQVADRREVGDRVVRGLRRTGSG